MPLKHATGKVGVLPKFSAASASFLLSSVYHISDYPTARSVNILVIHLLLTVNKFEFRAIGRWGK